MKAVRNCAKGLQVSLGVCFALKTVHIWLMTIPANRSKGHNDVGLWRVFEGALAGVLLKGKPKEIGMVINPLNIWSCIPYARPPP